MSRKSELIASLREFADRLEASELPEDANADVCFTVHGLTEVEHFRSVMNLSSEDWRFDEFGSTTWVETADDDAVLRITAFGASMDLLTTAKQ